VLGGGSLAGAAAATLLQEARLRFWWLVIDRSIFFGLQKKLRLLDFTYVAPWRARRLKPYWVSEAHHPPRGGGLGASGKRKWENKGEGRNSSRCGVRWNGVGKELRVF
jgi:hypothetical protein